MKCLKYFPHTITFEGVGTKLWNSMTQRESVGTKAGLYHQSKISKPKPYLLRTQNFTHMTQINYTHALRSKTNIGFWTPRQESTTGSGRIKQA